MDATKKILDLDATCINTIRTLSMDAVQAANQPKEYRDRVLPPAVTARVSVEQASTFGWTQYVGATGHSIGMRSFGASAPLKELIRKFGFTTEHVVAAAKEQLRRCEGVPA